MNERIPSIGWIIAEGASSNMGQNALRDQWVSLEQYRLEVVGGWPPSAYKEATLVAIYSSLTSLGSAQPGLTEQSPSVQSQPTKASVIHLVSNASPTANPLTWAA